MDGAQPEEMVTRLVIVFLFSPSVIWVRPNTGVCDGVRRSAVDVNSIKTIPVPV